MDESSSADDIDITSDDFAAISCVLLTPLLNSPIDASQIQFYQWLTANHRRDALKEKSQGVVLSLQHALSTSLTVSTGECSLSFSAEVVLADHIVREQGILVHGHLGRFTKFEMAYYAPLEPCMGLTSVWIPQPGDRISVAQLKQTYGFIDPSIRQSLLGFMTACFAGAGWGGSSRSVADVVAFLAGPPGSGRSSLALGAAKEAKARVLRVTAGRIRRAQWKAKGDNGLQDLFSLSLVLSPCVVYLDNLCSIFPSTDQPDSAAAFAETLSRFISFLSASKGRAGVFVIACGTSLSGVDPRLAALLSPALLGLPPPTAGQRCDIAEAIAQQALLQDFDGSFSRRRWGQEVSDRYAGLPLVSYIVQCSRAVEMKRREPQSSSSLGGLSHVLKEMGLLQLSNVAGHNTIKEILRECILWPRVLGRRLRQARARPAVGVLLYGPPGTGKTLLARECAAELSCSFLELRLTTVVRGLVGEGENALRELFAEARRIAPSVVFIDEFQAVFTSRGDGSDDVGSTLSSALASCIDDVAMWNEHAGDGAQVLVVGATNEPWAIDSALLRSNRVSRVVLVGPLDRDGRETMLSEVINATQLCTKEDSISILRQCVDLTAGFTAADIRLLLQRILQRLQVRGTGLEEALEGTLRSTVPSVSAQDMVQYARWAQTFRK